MEKLKVWARGTIVVGLCLQNFKRDLLDRVKQYTESMGELGENGEHSECNPLLEIADRLKEIDSIGGIALKDLELV